MNSEDAVYDATIVGCGPVGAVMANLLGQAGLHVAVFEASAGVYHLPRAAHFDAEVMRIFQAIGLADALLPATRPLKGMTFVNGEGKQLFALSAADESVHGWPQGFLFYQPQLEEAFVPVCSAFRRSTSTTSTRSQRSTRRASMSPSPCAMLGVASSAWFGRGTCSARTAVEAQRGSSPASSWKTSGFTNRGSSSIRCSNGRSTCPTCRRKSAIRRGLRPSFHRRGNHRRWEFMLMPGDTAESMEQPGRAAD